jgi:hypothetical protein
MTTTVLRIRLSRVTPRAAAGALLALVAIAWPQPAEAQLDPLLFLKRSVPSITTPSYRANVLVAVDTAPRMMYDADGHYYDPTEYARGNVWDAALGATTGARYRRLYQNLQWSSSGPQKFTTTKISTVSDASATAYANFYQKTRIGVARTALAQVITENDYSSRFGLLKMRHQGASTIVDGPALSSDGAQQLPTDWGGVGLWKVARTTTTASNRSIETSTAPLVRPDGASPNAAIHTILSQPLSSSSLLPAGTDAYAVDDAALAHLLDDLKTEASRLATADTLCRNTVAILITGGGEGTGGHTPSAASIAATFLNVGSSRRVPIYVVALAPPAGAVAELQAIASASGGKFYEITKAQIDLAAANNTAVPEVVRAMNDAVQHAFAQTTDFNTAPTVGKPYGPESEFLVTSPIVGTVDLEGVPSLAGATLPNTTITSPTSGAEIPQRGNVMITTGFAMPGFEARLRAFRVYKPVVDSTKPSGYKFTQDGTALWVARTPTTSYCDDASASCRNIYTILPGTTTPIAFSVANAGTLSPYLDTFDPEGLIDFVRRQPLGAIVSSTPAFMDPPSLDPPPDSEYPAFVEDNEDRRSLIFVGANDGMLHAIDGRTGVEVWAFIPFNLLPKLRTLRDGQPIDGFDYFMDSSVKVADVKVGDPGEWKTAIIVGQGAGGTFYQAFDATLEGMPSSVTGSAPGEVGQMLSYFSTADRIRFLWSFPDYSYFDHTYGTYGDVTSAAPVELKTVGQSWSDPAVGQVESPTSPYTVIVGSGFMPYSKEQQANRGGTAAGRNLYLLRVDDGKLYDTETVGSDGVAETIDNCVDEALGCTRFKNALQADPVATGPSDSRFISKTYIGDLDGKVWRFDVGLDATGTYPEFKSTPVHLNASSSAPDQPVFASMATVAVGTQQYIFYGTGSDLLPVTGQNTIFKLVGVLDNGGSGTVTFQHTLSKVDGVGDDEVVSSFPAVAGDIVFFTTTSMKPQNPCVLPDANLYALTFVGSAAYDATGDNKVTNNETPKLKTLVGAGRATAPFIVDQHLAFGAGTKIEMFGDPNDYNNGVGHVGVRILSWRDLR